MLRSRIVRAFPPLLLAACLALAAAPGGSHPETIPLTLPSGKVLQAELMIKDEDRAMEPVRRERAAGLRILRRKDAQVVPEAPGKMRLSVKITPRLSPGDVRRP